MVDENEEFEEKMRKKREKEVEEVSSVDVVERDLVEKEELREEEVESGEEVVEKGEDVVEREDEENESGTHEDAEMVSMVKETCVEEMVRSEEEKEEQISVCQNRIGPVKGPNGPMEPNWPTRRANGPMMSGNGPMRAEDKTGKVMEKKECKKVSFIYQKNNEKYDEREVRLIIVTAQENKEMGFEKTVRSERLKKMERKRLKREEGDDEVVAAEKKVEGDRPPRKRMKEEWFEFEGGFCWVKFKAAEAASGRWRLCNGPMDVSGRWRRCNGPMQKAAASKVEPDLLSLGDQNGIS